MSDRQRRDKGTGGLYQREDGYWVASLELPPHPDGRRRRKQIVRKRKADVISARAKALKEKDRAGDLRLGSPRVDSVVRDWIDSREASGRLRPKTATAYRSYLERHIAPRIGATRLDKLSAVHVERMTAAMVSDGLSPTSALQAHNILKGALKSAVRQGLVGLNAAEIAEPPLKSHYTAQVLTLDSAYNILLTARSQSVMAWARWSLALLAGMRQAEALGLTRHCVDLDRGVIRVQWQLQRLSKKPPATLATRHLGGRYYLTEPKSKAGVREVPMLGALRAALEARLAEIPEDPWALVVTGGKGGPMDSSRDSKDWHAILKAAGAPEVRLHDARHTAGTLMRQHGVETRIRQMVLGHSSVAVSEDYAHTGADEPAMQMGAFMGRFDGLIGYKK